MRTIPLLAALLSCAPCLAAPVKISYGIWDEIQAPHLRKIFDRFQKENPGIQVEMSVVPWNVYWQKIEAAAQGGAMADLTWMNMESAGKFALNGALEPLDGYLQKAGISWSDFPAFTSDAYRISGKTYGIPRDIDAMAVAYNKELLKKAGLAPPADKWTWEELLQAARQLKEKLPGVHAVGMDLSGQNSWYNFIYQNGGSVLNETKTKSQFNSPAGVKAVSQIRQLIDSGLMAERAAMSDFEAATLFTSGKIAIYFMGSWELIGVLSNKALHGNVGFVRMPVNGGRRASLSHTVAHVIAASSAHKKEAWALLEFLSSAQVQEELAASGLVIPARNGYLKKWQGSPAFRNARLDVSAFVRAFDDAVALPVTLNTMAWKTKEEETLKKVWLGKLSPEAAVQEIETTTNKALDKEQKLRKP